MNHQKRQKRHCICQIAMRSIDDLSFEVIILRVDGRGSRGIRGFRGCPNLSKSGAFVDGLWVDGWFGEHSHPFQLLSNSYLTLFGIHCMPY